MQARLRFIDIPIEAGEVGTFESRVVQGHTTATFERDVDPSWTELPGIGDRFSFVVEVEVADDEESERQLVLKVRSRTWVDLDGWLILDLEPEAGYSSLDLIPWWRGLVDELGLVERGRQSRHWRSH